MTKKTPLLSYPRQKSNSPYLARYTIPTKAFQKTNVFY